MYQYHYFNKDQKSKEVTVSAFNPLLAKHRQRGFKLFTSERGIDLRKQRCYDAEPVFAQIKHHNHFKRFFLWGETKVSIKMGLIAIAHNLKKQLKAA